MIHRRRRIHIEQERGRPLTVEIDVKVSKTLSYADLAELLKPGELVQT